MSPTNERCSHFYNSLSDSHRPLIIIKPHAECAEYDADRDIIIIDLQNSMDYSRLWSLIFHELGHREYRRLTERGTYIELSEEDYQPFREMVAETFSAVICSRLGIFDETKESQINYIRSWKQDVKNKSLLWFVTAMAVKIVENILNKKVYRLDVPLIVRSEFLGR